MGNIKHIIFDFDGTLANTWPVMFHACVSVFEKYDNRTLVIEDLYEMTGPTELRIIHQYLGDRDKVDAAVEDFVAHYEEQHEELVERDEAITDLLADLQQSGVGLALFTGKSRRTLDISLAKLGWNIPFSHIVTGDDVENSKPSPEGIHRIMDKLGWSREHTVFVGDSNDDMQAGRDAGVRTFAARWMSMVQDKDYRVPPERAFENLEDFRSYLAQHGVQFN